MPGRAHVLIAIRFPIEPDGTNSAASRSKIWAARSCKRLIVGSSPYTSSPPSASAMALRMAGVGRVTVSLRRSIMGSFSWSDGISLFYPARKREETKQRILLCYFWTSHAQKHGRLGELRFMRSLFLRRFTLLLDGRQQDAQGDHLGRRALVAQRGKRGRKSQRAVIGIASARPCGSRG